MEAKRTPGRILLLLFSVGWFLWTGLDWFGSILGNCADDIRCLAMKQYAPSLIMWRGLAIEAGALLLYAFYSRWQRP